jgi:hypothetical protein
MRRSPYRDRQVFWAAVTAVVIASLVLGWFGMWPYLAGVVAALYLFQVWYFRDSLRGLLRRSRSR